MAALLSLVQGFHELDPALWQFTAGRASIVAGQLQVIPGWIDPPDDTTVTTRFGGEVWSVQAYDAGDGESLTLEVPQWNHAGTGITEAGLFIGSPRTNALLWLFDQQAGVLKAVHRHPVGGTTVVGTVRLDDQETRFIRIRIGNDGLTAYWDTSPDGFTWTWWCAVGWAYSATPVRITLGTWFHAPADVVIPARFDSLNQDLRHLDPVTLTGNPGDPYLAVDVQPDVVTGVFVVGVSKLGGPDRLAWSADDPDTWVNVVCDVRTVDYDRGATRALGLQTRTEAGTATIQLLDLRSSFDPNSGEAITKGTPARLRAWGTDIMGERWDAVLFTGEVDAAVGQYLPGEDVPLVDLRLVDLVGPLSSWESDGEADPGVGAGDDLRERAQRFLETVGRGVVASTSSTAYSATLAPTRLQRPWDELLDAQEAELGRMWVDRLNRLVLRARGSQAAGPVRGTLSDVHGDSPIQPHCCIADASVVRGGAGIVNRVLASRVRSSDPEDDPARVRRDDLVSQRRYGVATVTRSSLPLETDGQVEAWAGALVTARTRPELRVDEVTPRPSWTDLDSAVTAWPAVLRTDVGDRWLFHYHPPTGPPVLRGLGVLGIHVSVTPEGWDVHWTTEDAPVPGRENPAGWFVVGLSTVGGTDLLAPYSAPAPMS